MWDSLSFYWCIRQELELNEWLIVYNTVAIIENSMEYLCFAFINLFIDVSTPSVTSG